MKYIIDIEESDNNLLYRIKGGQDAFIAKNIVDDLERYREDDTEEVYRAVCRMDDGDYEEAFKGISLENLILEHSAVEIKRMMEEYYKKRPPIMGDGVRSHDSIREGVCLYPMKFGCFVWWADGTGGFYNHKHIQRNGKQYDIVRSLFEQMGGE